MRLNQNLFDFTEFLLYNKDTIIEDIKPKIKVLLDKRKYFNGEFLLEYDNKLQYNMFIILRDYLIEELESSYIEVEENLLDTELDINGMFLDKDLYG